jgi:Uma2 family endonuclease
MQAGILETPTAGGPPPRKRFTRGEVERLAQAGFFEGQRFELIEGDLIDKMGQKPPHACAIRLLLALLVKAFGPERILIQLPVELNSPDREWSLPEPDLAILSEVRADYRHRHPRGDELRLAIEISDTTVQYDATVKRDLYARAGVPEYWVLDVNARRLIVHRNPRDGRFLEVDILAGSESIRLGDEPDTIAVQEILP